MVRQVISQMKPPSVNKGCRRKRNEDMQNLLKSNEKLHSFWWGGTSENSPICFTDRN